MPESTSVLEAPSPPVAVSGSPTVTIPPVEHLPYEQMPLRPMSLKQKILGALKYARVRLRGGPMLVNLEVTHLCNARCDFCDFWKSKDSGKLSNYDYIDALRHLDPLCVTLTGGEPTINKNLPDVVRNIKSSFDFIYVGMVTHGSLLTIEKAEALWNAGIDQIAISLNYFGAEHDAERGIPGLYEHISSLIPRMTARGINVVLNTVIMQDNLDHLIPLAYQARAWGAKISYSCYSDFKNGNGIHLIDETHIEPMKRVVEELINLKPHVGNIVSSRYYLRRVPDFFLNRHPSECQAAGKWLVQLTPRGEVKPCPELPATGNYRDFKKATSAIQCNRCWYSCRGETQAALTMERVKEVLGRV
jgi:MoaA/NifB/PqqE/SkfB family radical SAM enzyme